jgi:hypothetical protein
MPLTIFERQLSRFGEHCIERHGLDPNETERICWFDLEALTLTLLDDWRARVRADVCLLPSTVTAADHSFYTVCGVYRTVDPLLI